jgi:hypothetical protein
MNEENVQVHLVSVLGFGTLTVFAGGWLLQSSEAPVYAKKAVQWL